MSEKDEEEEKLGREGKEEEMRDNRNTNRKVIKNFVRYRSKCGRDNFILSTANTVIFNICLGMTTSFDVWRIFEVESFNLKRRGSARSSNGLFLKLMNSSQSSMLFRREGRK